MADHVNEKKPSFNGKLTEFGNHCNKVELTRIAAGRGGAHRQPRTTERLLKNKFVVRSSPSNFIVVSAVGAIDRDAAISGNRD